MPQLVKFPNMAGILGIAVITVATVALINNFQFLAKLVRPRNAA